MFRLFYTRQNATYKLVDLLRTGSRLDSVRTKTSIKIDRSKVPELRETDLEESFIKGSGPGGQCVNKSVNACFLKHLPTGLHVKVHHTRSLQDNRKKAREILAQKLDDLVNGEDSVSNQKSRIAISLLTRKKEARAQKRALKESYTKENKINQDEDSLE